MLNARAGATGLDAKPRHHLSQLGRVVATNVGLHFPSFLTYEEWERAGQNVARIASSSAWFIGDWVACGQSRYESRYRDAIEAVGLDYQTIRNYAWVARRFDLERRRESLSFQHHAEVASLELKDQDHWLALAEKLSWSRNQLRREVRSSRKGLRPEAEGNVVHPLKVDRNRAARWRRAAEHVGSSLEAWIIANLDLAARGVLAENERLDAAVDELPT